MNSIFKSAILFLFTLIRVSLYLNCTTLARVYPFRVSAASTIFLYRKTEYVLQLAILSL